MKLPKATLALLASRPVAAHLRAAREDLAAAEAAAKAGDWHLVVWRLEALCAHCEHAAAHAQARETLGFNGKGEGEGDHYAP